MKKLVSMICLSCVLVVSCFMFTACGEMTITKAEAQEVITTSLQDNPTLIHLQRYNIDFTNTITDNGKVSKTSVKGIFENNTANNVVAGYATYDYTDPNATVHSKIYIKNSTVYEKPNKQETISTSTTDELSASFHSDIINLDANVLFTINNLNNLFGDKIVKKNVSGGFSLTFELDAFNLYKITMTGSADITIPDTIIDQIKTLIKDQVNKVTLIFNNNNEVVGYELNLVYSYKDGKISHKTETKLYVKSTTENIITPTWAENL